MADEEHTSVHSQEYPSKRNPVVILVQIITGGFFCFYLFCFVCFCIFMGFLSIGFITSIPSYDNSMYTVGTPLNVTATASSSDTFYAKLQPANDISFNATMRMQLCLDTDSPDLEGAAESWGKYVAPQGNNIPLCSSGNSYDIYLCPDDTGDVYVSVATDSDEESFFLIVLVAACDTSTDQDCSCEDNGSFVYFCGACCCMAICCTGFIGATLYGNAKKKQQENYILI